MPCSEKNLAQWKITVCPEKGEGKIWRGYINHYVNHQLATVKISAARDRGKETMQHLLGS